MNWKARVPLFAAALWWGSLTAIGFIAVPLLFSHLPVSSAGYMAARLFTAQSWISIAGGLLLLITARSDEPARMDWGQGALGFVIAGLLLAVLLEYTVAPKIVTRQDPAFWHSLGTVFYGAQWVCAVVVFWKLLSARTS